MPELLIEIKQVYGNTLYYPACLQSLYFAELLHAKTLTKADMDIIKKLGYTFKPVQPTL